MTIIRQTSGPEAYEIPSLSEALPFRGLQAKDMDYLRFAFRDPKIIVVHILNTACCCNDRARGLNLIVFVFLGPGPRVSERNLEGTKTSIWLEMLGRLVQNYCKTAFSSETPSQGHALQQTCVPVRRNARRV